jgi:uncharacterized protein with von Willebrand factor type A (vWA) domain
VTSSRPSGNLLHNLVLFGRVLRGLGMAVEPGRLADLAVAAEVVGLRRREFHAAARCLLVRRREEIPLFDEAFDAFWRRPSEGWTTLDLRALGERRRFRRPQFARASANAAPGPDDAQGDGETSEDEPPALRPVLTWSAREQLRHKDFGEMTGEELDAVRNLIARLEWRPGLRPSRRRVPGGGRLPDVRRTLRRSLRHGGEVLRWDHRRPATRPRPLVVLADISGSMERYTRLLLLFLYGLSQRLDRQVETFLFGTRLTRVTRQLRGRDVEGALREVAHAVPDWSGGTRIGEAVRDFNFLWGRRVLGQGAVVLVISDGWDRGDIVLLGAEMARLQRSCHRLIWLNPLLGSPEYQPLARGIRTALPFVDDFLPVHSLASLEQLAGHLEGVGGGRPARPQRAQPHADTDA